MPIRYGPMVRGWRPVSPWCLIRRDPRTIYRNRVWLRMPRVSAGPSCRGKPTVKRITEATRPAIMAGPLHCDPAFCPARQGPVRAAASLRVVPKPSACPGQALSVDGLRPVPTAFSNQCGTAGNCWDKSWTAVEFALLRPRLLRGKDTNPSQLHPNNWVPACPGGSQCVSPSKSREANEQRNRYAAGRLGMQRDLPDLPDNAEVAGSIPASPTPRTWVILTPVIHSSRIGSEAAPPRSCPTGLGWWPHRPRPGSAP